MPERRKRLWIINHYAAPPTIPGGTRHHELARRLAKMDYDVTIVSSAFHHASRARRFDDPSGLRLEMVGDVRFVWIGSRTSYRASDVARVANMLEYALRVWWAGRRQFAGAAPRPDAVIGSSPHLLAALAASRLARRFHVPFILEIRDLWPETIVQMGVLPRLHPLVAILRALERYLYRRAARIVGLPPSIHEYLAPLGIPAGKVVTIPNGVDPDLFACGPPDSTGMPLRVVYAGAHGPANGLDNVLDAAERLVSSGVAEFHFYGEGSEKARLVRRTKGTGLGNVFFHAAVPKCEVPGILCAADILLLNYARIGIGKYGISPNKLWEYMASGRPIIFAHEAVNDPVAELGCGLSVPPGDPERMADAIRTLATMPLAERQGMGANGIAYVRANHDWCQLVKRLDALLVELIPGCRIG